MAEAFTYTSGIQSIVHLQILFFPYLKGNSCTKRGFEINAIYFFIGCDVSPYLRKTPTELYMIGKAILHTQSGAVIYIIAGDAHYIFLKINRY